MKFYVFLVITGLQWCYSVQENFHFLATRKLLQIATEGGNRVERRLTFSSHEEQTNFRKHFLPNTIPNDGKHQTEEKHGLTKREVTAEDIIKKLPQVYEPGTATRYTYPSENVRSLVNQTHLFGVNSSVISASPNYATIERSISSNVGVGEIQMNVTEGNIIEASTEQVKSVIPHPTSSPNAPENNGYNFLLLQLRKIMKKPSNKTVFIEKSFMQLSNETNFNNDERSKGNSTMSLLHTPDMFENSTLSVPITEPARELQFSNQTSENQSETKMDDSAEEHHGDASVSLQADIKFTGPQELEELSGLRGRPKIVLPDKSTLDSEVTEDHQEAESETRKSLLIFKIKDPLIYASSEKVSENLTIRLSEPENISPNATDLHEGSNKASDANVTGSQETVRANRENLTDKSEKHDGSDSPGNIMESTASVNVASPEIEGINNANESITSINFSHAMNTSLKANASINSQDIIANTQNKASLLLNPFLNAGEPSFPFLSSHSDLIQNSWNAELNQSSLLQNQTLIKSPLKTESRNFTGLLDKVPISPARLLPQNLLGYNFNPSKPFNFHSPSTPTSPFASTSSGLLGLESGLLGLGSWNQPPYLTNAGKADFRSPQHFGASPLGVPGSLGGTSISPAPSTLGGVDLGGLDFLSLLSSLGGFNSPAAPSGVDFSSSGTANSPYSIGSLNPTFQSAPLNQLLLKRIGAPSTHTGSESFEPTAVEGTRAALTDKAAI